MTDKQYINKELIFYDFEVFQSDWLMCAIIVTKNDTSKVSIVNDVNKLKRFYYDNDNNIWIGYNSRRYDQFILKGLILGYEPKSLNDYIINGGNPWKYSEDINRLGLINYDVMNSTDKSLKVYEGYQGHSIIESSVSFDIDRSLTQEELKEVTKYCMYDVQETMKVFNQREDDFKAQLQLIRLYNLPLSYLNKTKVQLSAEILKAQKYSYSGDEFDIKLPEQLRIEKHLEPVEWFLNLENHNYNKKLDYDVRDLTLTFAYGGLHGAIKKYHDTGYFLNVDVASLYPSIDILYSDPCFTRAVDSEGLETYKEIKAKRLELKNQGKKKEQAPYKIVLNGTYGAMKDKYNKLYDPRGANNTCVYGQLFMLDLIEHLEDVDGLQMIQVNTDGILMRLEKPDKLDHIKMICSDWEQRTGLTLDYDYYYNGELYQKDVNNYVLIDCDSKEYKSKGAYVKKLNPLDYDIPILNQALIEYMINGTPIETTVNNCEDLIQFQIIRKISNKFSYLISGCRLEKKTIVNPKTNRKNTINELNLENSKILNEKCIRCFASVEDKGTIYKKPVKSNNLQKVEGLPINVFIDNSDISNKSVTDELNKDWYIQEGYKRLKGFMPENSKKEEPKAEPTTIDKKSDDPCFIGYIPTRGKEAHVKWGNPKNHKTLEQVRGLKSYAGVLSKDIIVIDIDNMLHASILLDIVKSLEIKTIVRQATRGMHFYFKTDGNKEWKNQNHIYNFIGLECDYKVGANNAYATLKYKGIERNVIYNTGLDVVPYFLKPLGKNNRFFEMSEEGNTKKYTQILEGSRNELLFKYVRTIYLKGFTEEQTKETINIINEYIFKEPLPISEINTITRDDYFKELEEIRQNDVSRYFNKKEFLHNIYAMDLIEESEIIRYNGDLWTFDGQIYRNGKRWIDNRIITDLPTLKDHQRKEVYKFIDAMINAEKEETSSNYIAFNNGILNIETMELLPFDKEYIITNLIPWDYNPSAYSSEIDNYFKSVTDDNQELTQLLLESIGYIFYRRSLFGACFFLVGPSGTGKSTFLSLVSNVLGKENITNMDLEELGGRFNTIQALGKLAIIGDDIEDDSYIKGTTKKILKKFATGSPLQGERKNETPINFVNYAKMFFSSNEMPRFDNHGLNAINDRLLILPFNHRFRHTEEQDHYLLDKLTTQESMEYLIILAVKGLERLLKNRRFTECEEVYQMKDKFKTNNNNVLEWLQMEEIDRDKDIIEHSTKSVHHRYQDYCKSNDLNPYGQKRFNTILKQELNLQSVRSTKKTKPRPYIYKSK